MGLGMDRNNPKTFGTSAHPNASPLGATPIKKKSKIVLVPIRVL